jgi:hypothetical protein
MSGSPSETRENAMIAKTIASSSGAALALSLAGAAVLSAAGMVPAYAETHFSVTNLVSDGAVPAKIVDPNLINPWGIAMSPTSPFWISDLPRSSRPQQRRRQIEI